MYLGLRQIKTNGGTQPRETLDEELVKDYAQKMKARVKFPPVVVFFDGADRWLADGFHRYAAAIHADLEKIDVEIRQGTRRDAILYSVGANEEHGNRRTDADRRRAVLTLLNDQEWSQWSNVEIAKRCNVSEGFVRLVRDDASSNDTKIPAAERPAPKRAQVVDVLRAEGLEAYTIEELMAKCGVSESVVRAARDEFKGVRPRKAMRNGKEYTINTKNIGKRKREQTAKALAPIDFKVKSPAVVVRSGDVERPAVVNPPKRASAPPQAIETFEPELMDAESAFVRAIVLINAGRPEKALPILERGLLWCRQQKAEAAE